jgi:hypothetical protein
MNIRTFSCSSISITNLHTTNIFAEHRRHHKSAIGRESYKTQVSLIRSPGFRIRSKAHRLQARDDGSCETLPRERQGELFYIDSTKLVHELLGPGPTLRAMNARVLSEVATYLDPLGSQFETKNLYI